MKTKKTRTKRKDEEDDGDEPPVVREPDEE